MHSLKLFIGSGVDFVVNGFTTKVIVVTLTLSRKNFRYLTSRSSLLGGMDAWKLIRSRMTPPTLGDISHLVGLKIRAIHRLVTARNQR